jgi:adenosylcobinamide-phosphate synthase
MNFAALEPSGAMLLAAVFLDALIGGPRYALHPVRLMGRTLSRSETLLRKAGSSGYLGGCLLLAVMVAVWVLLPGLVVAQVQYLNSIAGFAVSVFLIYSMLALRDLIDHVLAVQRAARRQDVEAARQAIGRLVGRDTSRMDLAACRRAAIESLAENFVDGFVSAVFWYVLLGIPGLLLFKVASTMDSMVGYRTPQYLKFGWCGARLDDLMNYFPARIAWLVLGAASLIVPGVSAVKGWRIGLAQHRIVPGPNPGWSEATMAGLLERRLIGPIFKDGQLVTTVWLGDPSDPDGGADSDLTRSVWVTLTASFIVVTIALAVIFS